MRDDQIDSNVRGLYFEPVHDEYFTNTSKQKEETLPENGENMLTFHGMMKEYLQSKNISVSDEQAEKLDLFSSRSLSGNISTNASEVMTLPRVENEDEPSEDSPEENGTENSNGTGTTPHDNEETFENKKSDPFHFHIAPIVIYYDDENKTILEDTQSREKTSSSSGNKSISGMKIKSGHNAIESIFTEDEEIDLQNNFDPRKETCFQVFENCSSNQVNFTTGRDCLVQCGRAFIESIFTEDEEIDLQNNFDPRKETCFQVFENCS
ncbi:hypothetical protein Avbf_05035 [Armadillidium vulgare]|nr:hypothetical protein Avbf_05035 [Armadillidium vulgare]